MRHSCQGTSLRRRVTWSSQRLCVPVIMHATVITLYKRISCRAERVARSQKDGEHAGVSFPTSVALNKMCDAPPGSP